MWIFWYVGIWNKVSRNFSTYLCNYATTSKLNVNWSLDIDIHVCICQNWHAHGLYWLIPPPTKWQWMLSFFTKTCISSIFWYAYKCMKFMYQLCTSFWRTIYYLFKDISFKVFNAGSVHIKKTLTFEEPKASSWHITRDNHRIILVISGETTQKYKHGQRLSG